MYGVEAASSAAGLAATAPAGYLGLQRALAIRPMGSALIGGPPQSGIMLPAAGIGDQTALPIVSMGGGAVESPAGRQLGGWRAVLDWHSSPAPWVLLAILGLYFWSHMSYPGRRR
jgi:hypothetical protein